MRTQELSGLQVQSVYGLNALDMYSDLPKFTRYAAALDFFKVLFGFQTAVWHVTGYPLQHDAAKHEQYSRYYLDRGGVLEQENSGVFLCAGSFNGVKTESPRLPLTDDLLVQGLIDDGIGVYFGAQEDLTDVLDRISQFEADLPSNDDRFWLEQILDVFAGAAYTGNDGKVVHIASRCNVNAQLNAANFAGAARIARNEAFARQSEQLEWDTFRMRLAPASDGAADV